MIKDNPSTHSWFLTCDHCRRLEELRTVKNSAQVAPTAARLGWAMASPRGGLCPQCAKQWRIGLLDGENPSSGTKKGG